MALCSCPFYLVDHLRGITQIYGLQQAAQKTMRRSRLRRAAKQVAACYVETTSMARMIKRLPGAGLYLVTHLPPMINQEAV